MGLGAFVIGSRGGRRLLRFGGLEQTGRGEDGKETRGGNAELQFLGAEAGGDTVTPGVQCLEKRSRTRGGAGKKEGEVVIARGVAAKKCVSCGEFWPLPLKKDA